MFWVFSGGVIVGCGGGNQDEGVCLYRYYMVEYMFVYIFVYLWDWL